MNYSGTIILLGMKHSGKTTTGKILADTIGCPFLDTDDVIAAVSGNSPRELWDSGGAPLMMHWETRACESVLAGYGRSMPGEQCILATGGGIADNSDACALLPRIGKMVYLDTAADILFPRIEESARRDGRLPPFLQEPDPRKKFLELFSTRTARYATIADVIVETGQLPPDDIARRILDLLAHE